MRILETRTTKLSAAVSSREEGVHLQARVFSNSWPLKVPIEYRTKTQTYTGFMTRTSDSPVLYQMFPAEIDLAPRRVSNPEVRLSRERLPAKEQALVAIERDRGTTRYYYLTELEVGEERQ